MKSSKSTFQIPMLYTPFLGILLIFVAISLLNIPILVTLSRHSFDDGTYSHAFLIPFISMFLYFKLAEIGKLTYRDNLSFTCAAFFITSCFLLFITSTAQISLGYWLSLLTVSIASICMLYRFNWYIIFPGLFLIFIFPFWGLLTPILQEISIIAVTYMMSFTNVPTFVEAEFVTIPAGVFEIADGCSGLRYFIVSIAISSLFCFLYINSLKQTIKFLTLAIFGALLTNWIRITALILIGEYTNMESSLMEDHNTFGWYLYIPFMFILFYWGNKLSNIDLLNTKNSKHKHEISKLPNIKLTISFLLCLIISSTTIQSYPELFSVKKDAQENAQTQPKPKVFYYSEIENVASSKTNQNDIYNIYHFNGADLDGKPTYFENQLVPQGWKVLERKTNEYNKTFLIASNKKKAILSTSLEINNAHYSTNRAFKIARLKSALKGIKNSTLHWNFKHCNDQCSIN